MSYTRESDYNHFEHNSMANNSLVRHIKSIQSNKSVQQKFKSNLKIINRISPEPKKKIKEDFENDQGRVLSTINKHINNTRKTTKVKLEYKNAMMTKTMI